MSEQTTEVVRKDLGTIEIKNEEKGEVEAVIATLNVVDLDHDVIVSGAIDEGAKVKMSGYGHDTMFGDIPVGRGSLHVADDQVVFRGKMFMSTTRGRETFEVLKETADDQEWSFGFRVIGREEPDDEWREKGAFRMLTKLDAFEVSPVLIGAGRGTRTLAVKDTEKAVLEAEEVEEADETPEELELDLEGKGGDDVEEEETADEYDGDEEMEALADAEAKAAEAEREALFALKAGEAREEFERVQRTLRRLNVI